MAIKRYTLSDQILTEVIRIIKENNYKEGDMIPTEMEFSEDLGVSRNSVREALKTLNIAGVIRSIPGKGTVLNVNPQNVDIDPRLILRHFMGASLIDTLYVRKALECEAAELAARRAKDDPEDVRRMSKANESLTKALQTGSGRLTRGGQRFHLAVAVLSGNELLLSLIKSISVEYDHSVTSLKLGMSDNDTEIALHTAICDAVASGDPAAARQAMEAHYENTFRIYRKQLKEDGA
jgi:GntR family transcriptional repressor for pyruvate dehydrogenase complex